MVRAPRRMRMSGLKLQWSKKVYVIAGLLLFLCFFKFKFLSSHFIENNTQRHDIDSTTQKHYLIGVGKSFNRVHVGFIYNVGEKNFRNFTTLFLNNSGHNRLNGQQNIVQGGSQSNSGQSENIERNSTLSNVKISNEAKLFANGIANPCSDCYISVKTTSKFHESRLRLLVETWYTVAKKQVYFFTDSEDRTFKKILGDHLINTNCSSVHSRQALCCKMSAEYDYFISSNKKWFCHVDDDTYLNVVALGELLSRYDPAQDWYLGKPSLDHPLEVTDHSDTMELDSVWFATGGAGFCISASLAVRMLPYAGNGQLKVVCDRIKLPDDCTVGYIIYHYLHQKLTVIPQFHSHLESLELIQSKELQNQITISYSKFKHTGRRNVIRISGFNTTVDPTRFYSLHCKLYPNTSSCQTYSQAP